MRRLALTVLATVCLATAVPAWAAGADGPPVAGATWPQFRGPEANGIADGSALPTTWSATDNVAWSVAIPGKGWSSPIVWGDRIFVTAAVPPGEVERPVTPRGLAANVTGVTSKDKLRWIVSCVDWSTGKTLWERTAYEGVPDWPIHQKASYASETPLTDGERVYAYFGNVGMFCYSMTGECLWSRRWGTLKMGWNWGTAASPVRLGDRIYLVNDNEQQSFLVAIDSRTGQDVWRVERAERSNWCTPFVWRTDQRTEIVTSGSGRVRSYDLDGEVLWELRGMSGVTVPAPFAAEGLLYLASGCTGSPRKPIYAIRPGAMGDISLVPGGTGNASVAWCRWNEAPYVPSPLVYRGLMYVLNDYGWLSCYDAATGAEVYARQQFGEGGRAFTASPWACDGKIYCLAEKGDTFVVQAGREFRVLAKNSIGEDTLATPAVAQNSLILRTLTKLYQIRSS